MIIIGSLAVAYQYFGPAETMFVQTKDAYCMISPHVRAIPTGIAVTERLFEAEWRFREDENWPKPGRADTPDQDLPAVRLHPPGQTDWFLELLTVPESPAVRTQQWSRLETRFGHFGICSFGFFSLVDYEPIATDLGISIARPEMMALANLLEHPEIKPETMTGDPDTKRSNKDLGRVLAIARLALGKDENSLLAWSDFWREALEARFPDEWAQVGAGVGKGLRALLSSPEDLNQALRNCRNGILVSRPPTAEQFRITGERLLQDAVEPLEALTLRPE